MGKISRYVNGFEYEFCDSTYRIYKGIDGGITVERLHSCGSRTHVWSEEKTAVLVNFELDLESTVGPLNEMLNSLKKNEGR